MATLDNPAGRLYELLSAFREAADSNVSVVSTWAKVYNTESEQVPTLLCGAASLIPDIEAAILVADDIQMIQFFQTFADQWLEPIMTIDTSALSVPNAGPELVNHQALMSLGMLSSMLSATQSEGLPPSSEVRDAMRTHIGNAIEATRKADDLGPELRTALLTRLHDILWALDRVETGGADAIDAALERVAGAVRLRSTAAAKAPGPMQRIMDAVGRAYAVFKLGEEAGAALEGWQDFIPPALGGGGGADEG